MPFEKGNQLRKGKSAPNSGRKADKDIAELQRVMDKALDFEERVEIFRVMGARARSGDSGAAKLVLGYLYGTPVQRAEITGAGGGPIEMKHDLDDLRKLSADELIRLYREKIQGGGGDRV